MTATVQIHNLVELIEFLNKVKDPGEWRPVDNVEVDACLEALE